MYLREALRTDLSLYAVPDDLKQCRDVSFKHQPAIDELTCRKFKRP